MSADTSSGATASVLFLCTHNAGRSQMAAGFMTALSGGRVAVYSGGSEPAADLNPMAVEAMAEVGIDITGRQPRRWTRDMVESADVVVSMGCGDSCPVLPGKQYLDWDLDDPAGQTLETTRTIRDEIEQRVAALVSALAD